MLSHIITFSIRNKLIVLLFTAFVIGFGFYSLSRISIGAVPDITNNQVQVITTSRNLSTQDMEQFITYPVELEMANLPGVLEIRSITKFGLSVVTIVFEDELGTYLPRQLIAEKIKSASEKIPEGFGTPFMGPITTGLGEIYQYILDVKPGYEDRYSATDLRTIQDWIVKRQLSGIPGVVEVNTWGGYLKQYEVAITTEKLIAMDITARDVFEAMEKNNSAAGGGYIEKVNQAYFIRGEGLVNTLEDIENIVVKIKEGIPILIKDVATVGYGHATRFGAITGNGEGEKVLGQVMMLKNANAKKVIEAVKQRVATIANALPEGVYINAFLDRSELIGKTTSTVTENLILGCLIVVFVVVLLLGNIRSGLVVASVIPLSLLFALCLMYLFGVDANLMSLGAIDFGIIIDGAVIIVEYIAFQITVKAKEFANDSKARLQSEKDKITIQSASRMMNSAIFGQLIILIVFIPILSLSGVEGKMFRPMALTFGFALLGAMLFCFTYVPVAAAIFIKPEKIAKSSISTKIMAFFTQVYEPVIAWALRSKKIVIGFSLMLLLLAGGLFSFMGSEFVPTLDEGDFVIQPVLKTGTSLSKTIEITTKIEKILLDNFPEVKQVVTRIGAAEVPTDPMSMEESDVIIILQPKSEWVSGKTKDDLAAKFKKALAIIPGMEVEFTQPIEMRFNELITGVRADLAIKIFGADLEVLSAKANEISTLIANVEGAADISVEKIVGLPQMNVVYNREKVARYGLNIQQLNEMVSMGFAGRTVGDVYEGEKRFDLVVRLDKRNRKDLNNLKNLYVDIPKGGKIPLSELAQISYQKGAAKISRDDTRRRVVVGVNVREKDLQSVVNDIQELVQNNIELPVGYFISYGGQYQNLQSAKSRLAIAVPIALILIFILLYFAFKSAKEALIIFTAIPLSAVGGVCLLWLRDMPFSISAGVGFIALFGIAVLNGIVLIEHLKTKKKADFENVESLIIQATKDRLRAVLLTASAAALGFLPMALSTNVGAEVQRPLATVVIGGLITATLLTLVVLPVLYAIFYGSAKQRPIRFTNKTPIVCLLLLFLSLPGIAQENAHSLDDLKVIAVENNAGLRAAKLKMNYTEAMIGSAFNFGKTAVYYNYDENNLTLNNNPLRVFGVQQDFLFPTVYFAEKNLNRANLLVETANYNIALKAISRKLTAAYYEYLSENEKQGLYRELDSLYGKFALMAERKFELGETNYLEKITAQSRKRQIEIKHAKAEQNVLISYRKLLSLVQSDSDIVIKRIPISKIALAEEELQTLAEIDYYQQRIRLRQAKKSLEKQQLLPDIGFEYFQGSTPELSGNLSGYQIGLKIPLLFNGKASRIRAASIAEEMAVQEATEITNQLQNKLQELKAQHNSNIKALEYFEKEGSQLADEILKTAIASFKNGEIDFFQYIQSIENAYEIKLAYLEQLNSYNQTVISINHLTY